MISGLLRLLYNLCITCSWPFLYLYYAVITHNATKYRRSFRSRMGLHLPPDLPGADRIWVHALSVGETLSAAPLVSALKRRYPECEIVFSTATEAGQEIARKKLASWISHPCYLPHDFPWAVISTIRRLKPSVFILVETDIWPNLIHFLKSMHVPVILVNGRISPKSFQRLSHVRPIVGAIFRDFEMIFAQSSEDKEHYLSLGAPAERLFVEGNLKFDAAAPEESSLRIAPLAEDLGIGHRRPAWIGGSTHPGEEELLLDIHKALRENNPNLLLILAPRQIGRASDIASMCNHLGLSVALRSTGFSAKGKAVFVVDTLGELKSFYAFAQAAFIGGSMVPFGGHNPLEPVAQGKPTIWGPHLFNFREIEASLIDAGCGVRVTSKDELQARVAEWLARPEGRKSFEEKIEKFFSRYGDCSRRITDKIATLLKRQNKNRF